MGDEGQLVYILFGFSKIFDFLSADGKDKLKVALEKGKHELKVNFVLIDEGTSLAKQSMDNWYKVQCGNLSGVWVGDGSSEQYILKSLKSEANYIRRWQTGWVFISIKEDITLLNTSVQKQILKKKQRCRKWMRYLLKCIFRHREKHMI